MSIRLSEITGPIVIGSGMRFTITSAGNVGVGTSSPSKKLSVSDGGAIGFEVSPNEGGNGFNRLISFNRVSVAYVPVAIEGEYVAFSTGTGSSGTERMRINSAGNVGIGTTAPSQKVHVVGDVLATPSTWGTSGTGAVYVGDTNNYYSATFGAPAKLGSFNDLTFGVGVTQTERMRIDASGNVGIGTSSPSNKLTVDTGPFAGSIEVKNTNGTSTFGTGGGNFTEIANISNGTIDFYTSAAQRMRIDSAGNVGIGTTSPSEKLSVTGNVTISGSLSKGSGSFKIDHPIKPDTHHLVHSFVEAPQADNIYRGKVDLVNGQATINIDEAGRMTEGTFEALNCNVQCFTTNEENWTCVRGSVTGNILTIEAEDNTCTDTISWMVIGERCDQHMVDADWTDENGRVITEPEKDKNDES
jgi:hypothetical protein